MDFDILSFLIGGTAGVIGSLAVGRAKYREFQDRVRELTQEVLAKGRELNVAQSLIEGQALELDAASNAKATRTSRK